MTRLMSIDYGLSRVGIALTDPLQITVSGYITLEAGDKLIDRIIEIIKQKSVSAVVIGIPFDQNSLIGPQAQLVIDFAKNLKTKLDELSMNIKLFEQDERFSTINAYSVLKLQKTKNKNKKSRIDQVAACAILDEFLTSRIKKEFSLFSHQ